MENTTLAKLKPQGCSFCSILVQEQVQMSGADFMLYTHKSRLQSVVIAAKSGCQGCSVLLFAIHPFIVNWDDQSATISVCRSYYGRIVCETSGNTNPTFRVEVNKMIEQSGSYSNLASSLTLVPADLHCSSYLLATFPADRRRNFATYRLRASDKYSSLMVAYVCY
jgi:hypothetical protein